MCICRGLSTPDIDGRFFLLESAEEKDGNETSRGTEL